MGRPHAIGILRETAPVSAGLLWHGLCRRNSFPNTILMAMHATSQKQQKAAGAALSAKRGETPKAALKGASRQMVKTMSEEQLEEMASAKQNELPTRSTND
jgi:hypothetical protein